MTLSSCYNSKKTADVSCAQQFVICYCRVFTGARDEEMLLWVIRESFARDMYA